METYAGLIENGLVIQVVVASPEWAIENGYVPQTKENCDYERIAIGDSYDTQINKYTKQEFPHDEETDDFVAPTEETPSA